MEDPALDVLAPDLIFSEVANGFRKVSRASILAHKNLLRAIDDLSNLDLVAVGVRPLLTLVGPLLLDLSAYDACYLALALSRRAALATFDRRLASVAASHGVALSLPTD